MLLGVDDTDSLAGGCTTHVAVRIALRLGEEMGLVLLGNPRLVRLNPSNPWKTRGNAALALHLGLPAGSGVDVGLWDGDPIVSFPEGEDVPPTKEVMDTAWDVVQTLTWREDGRTNPGLVLVDAPGPDQQYDMALHSMVDPRVLTRRLEREGVLHRAEGSRRGLVGASAAVSWRMQTTTWELIAYRPKDRWGQPREVDPTSVEEMDKRNPSTFDSFDPGSGGLTMVPASPCPVLFGIRGTDPEVLPAALRQVRSEPFQGWALFVTNQATDDHLTVKGLGEVTPYESVVVRGTVSKAPVTIPGGHVILEITDGDATLAAAAYEPTKEFRDLVRKLAPGDSILACGSVRDEPRTVNLEKVKIIDLGDPTARVKVSNPACPDCGKSMKSMGADAGYRCMRCGTKATEDEATFEEGPRDVEPGWYEVPPDARRHLARPLRLGVLPELED
jgi:tRNA(Ile2)-agmatinylcytidine synthase